EAAPAVIRSRTCGWRCSALSWCCRPSRQGIGPAAAAFKPTALGAFDARPLDLAQRRLECLAQGHAQLFAGMAADALMADDNRALARHPDFDLDAVDLRLLCIALGGFEHHAAARHALAMLGKLGNLFAHALFDRLTFLESVKMHLDRSVHGISCLLRSDT